MSPAQKGSETGAEKYNEDIVFQRRNGGEVKHLGIKEAYVDVYGAQWYKSLLNAFRFHH